MNVRDQNALAAAQNVPFMSLDDLAEGLVGAIAETRVEGGDPGRDPAVLLFRAFIAFHTHADVNSVAGYQALIGLVADRLNTTGTMQ